MAVPYKPEGYSSVSPYLVVKNAEVLIDFITAVFGGIEQARYPGENDRIMHAEVKIEDSVIMLANSADEWPPVPAMIHVYVKDVDSTYQKALDKGARSIQKPEKKDDSDKRGGVEDTNGVQWWIGTKVE